MLCLFCVVLLASALGGVPQLSNDDKTANCCPTCDPWNGDCPFATWSQASFATQAACVSNCTGGCLYNPSSTWDCVNELCAPNPCAFSAESVELRDGLSTRLGSCVSGQGQTLSPDKTMGIPGAYAALVNQSQTMLYKGGYAPLVTGWVEGSVAHLVSVHANRVYWVVTNPDDDSAYYLRSQDASGVVAYTFLLGSEDDLIVYAASDAVLVTGTYVPMQGSVLWAAFVAGQPNSPISSVLIRQSSSLIDYWPIVKGTTAFVMTSFSMVSPPEFKLYHWDVHANATVTEVNVTFTGCLAAGQTADTINTGDIGVFCEDDSQASTCTLYFAARTGEELPAYLCKMSVESGAVKPVIDTPYIQGATVAFFQTGVVVSAGSFETKVSPDDLMVYLYDTNSYHWVNDELTNTVAYCYAPAFVNMHLPGGLSFRNYWVLMGDVLVYRVTPGLGSSMFFAYNLTSQRVDPLTPPFGLPNTKCNAYTYGGNCGSCEDEVVGGFTSVYAMANGSLVLEESKNVYVAMQYGLTQVDAPALVSSVRCGVDNSGCSATGGTCIAGVCHCLAGCSGVDCRQGAAFCSEDTLTCPR